MFEMSKIKFLWNLDTNISCLSIKNLSVNNGKYISVNSVNILMIGTIFIVMSFYNIFKQSDAPFFFHVNVKYKNSKL